MNIFDKMIESGQKTQMGGSIVSDLRNQIKNINLQEKLQNPVISAIFKNVFSTNKGKILSLLTGIATKTYIIDDEPTEIINNFLRYGVVGFGLLSFIGPMFKTDVKQEILNHISARFKKLDDLMEKNQFGKLYVNTDMNYWFPQQTVNEWEKIDVDAIEIYDFIMEKINYFKKYGNRLKINDGTNPTLVDIQIYPANISNYNPTPYPYGITNYFNIIVTPDKIDDQNINKLKN